MYYAKPLVNHCKGKFQLHKIAAGVGGSSNSYIQWLAGLLIAHCLDALSIKYLHWID